MMDEAWLEDAATELARLIAIEAPDAQVTMESLQSMLARRVLQIERTMNWSPEQAQGFIRDCALPDLASFIAHR